MGYYDILEKNRNILLFIDGEDATTKVEYVQQNYNKIVIKYVGNEKVYNYSFSRAQFFKVIEKVNSDTTKIWIDGKENFYFDFAQIFKDYIRIINENGYFEVYEKSRVKIEKSALDNLETKRTFDYFKELAGINSLDYNGTKLLSKNYGKCFVRKQSVLADYLKGNFTQNAEKISDIPIFPFGFNLSQKEAVEKVFQNKISVIEGPPGTGKTQTILNIIANAIMHDKKVAVASSNNSATSNVFEKLQKYDLSFFAAFLGGTVEEGGSRKKYFIDHQPEIPELSNWKKDQKQKENLLVEIHTLYDDLQSKLAARNQLAKLEQKHEEIRLERKYFVEDYGKQFDSDSEIILHKKLSSENFMELWVRYENLLIRNKQFNVWRRLVNRIKLGISNQEIYSHASDEFIFLCQKNFYDELLRELELQITECKDILVHFSFEGKLQDYQTLSMKYFKAFLHDNYHSRKRRKFKDGGSKEEGNLWKNSEAVLQEYPVILSTTFSLSVIFSDNPLYDYVILDEASQVDLATGALALSCAKNVVIVGDLKQLPNVVTKEDKINSEQIFKSYNLSESYQYSTHSLLQSIKEVFPNSASTLLREHYRCHSKIIGFCNKKFYNDELIVLSKSEASEASPLAVITTKPSEHMRWSIGHKNQRELDEVENILLHDYEEKNEWGVITPYRKQANELQKMLSEEGYSADTVDKYQGREKNKIIFSTVDNKITQFSASPNRLNVAVSRAIKKFILVVNGNGEEKRNNNISDLINYIKYNNFDVSESKIYSIFDYLFEVNKEARKRYLKGKKYKSRFDSENLMFSLIEEILGEDRFSKFKVVPQYQLKLLIRDFDGLGLSERERKYAVNSNTRIDFLIESKMDKSPVLAIEVDGVTFHNENTAQFERDKLKNHILEVCGVKLQRFPTDGSREKERLTKLLEEYLLLQDDNAKSEQ
ncbi:AAA domain-containing protein [Lactococcus protaetiae]|uniref:DUF2726 domain-containing protein n=1 Tax=Lactococcus protaetiae TaxID=2592653 RepID=A0A514Z8S3_9LACT|nr:AAA domain-containing protein [Lactococcus protaetiae]QDK70989.1 DUF2726 domain-containing protein [Lactococcus protaetiae]